MQTLVLYKEDINNPLHPFLWESMLEELGIDTHVQVAGRSVDLEITEVTLDVKIINHNG